MEGDYVKQPWHCDYCRRQGIVVMDDHIDVMGGMQALRADHRSVSPECDRFDMVRVANLSLAWAEMRFESR